MEGSGLEKVFETVYGKNTVTHIFSWKTIFRTLCCYFHVEIAFQKTSNIYCQKKYLVLMKRLLKRLQIKILQMRNFKLMLLTHLWPILFYYCLPFWRVFWRIWWHHQYVLRTMAQTYPYWKPQTLCYYWWKFEVNWTSDVPSGSGYVCEETKIYSFVAIGHHYFTALFNNHFMRHLEIQCWQIFWN